jgi:hypothetical protein
MTTRYVHNYGAFDRLVLNSEMMRDAMHGRAERVQERFVETAPVSDEPDDEHRGRYKDSSTVESGLDGGPHHDRAYGRVTVHDPAAMSIEFGHRAEDGSHVEGSYTLTNALNAALEDD